MEEQNKTHVLSRAIIIHNDKILLCKTLDLENNYHYLPGGHIAHGESATEYLTRELKKETGAICKVQKFLGCLEHGFEPVHKNICHNHEYNFVFQASSASLTSDQKIASMKQYIELVWVPTRNIKEIDFRPEPLQELIPKWLEEHNLAEFTNEV